MNAKTATITIIIIIILATSVIFAVRMFSGEDSWICQDGQWMKHGNPSSSAPKSGCEKVPKEKSGEAVEEDNTVETSGDGIKVSTPKSGYVTASPLEVSGVARGTWFFEGDFPVSLVDGAGKVIATAPARALGEWMTEDFVPFRAILEAPSSFIGPATVVLTQDDPSGQAKTKELKIPVTLEKSAVMKIKLYFSSLYLDPESANCSQVYEVERVIPKTQAVAKAALEELLKGATDLEKSGGYYTHINPEANLKSIAIANGVAKADFDSGLEKGVGGSCKTSAIRAQIEKTLKQFPTVKDVVISIDGKTEGVLQP